MAIKSIIGQVARGDDFYPRPKTITRIWEKLRAGSNLLIVAPRRVGKSSILLSLQDNPEFKYHVVYYISESVNDENEFFKKLIKNTVDSLQGMDKYSQKFKSFAKDLASRFEQIGMNGVTLGCGKLNYFDEFLNFVKNHDFDGERLIILVDEFAQTVENILEDQGQTQTIHFLQSNRVLRGSPDLYKKVQFIYAGSIGLENIVSKINSVNEINDLAPITVHPLLKNEAIELALKIIEGTEVTFAETASEYIVKKIHWLIPFYIQLVLDESYKIILDKKVKIITPAIIDEAIANAIKQRNQFEHWFTRLRKAYKGAEFNFAKDVLNLASEKQIIAFSDIFNLAIQYKIEDSYKDILNALKHDGYVNNDEDPIIYSFNDPILKIWWNRNVAN